VAMEANASVLRLTLSRDGDDWKAMKSIIGSIKSEENKNEPPISGPNPLSDLVILPGVSLPIVAGVWVRDRSAVAQATWLCVIGMHLEGEMVHRSRNNLLGAVREGSRAFAGPRVKFFTPFFHEKSNLHANSGRLSVTKKLRFIAFGVAVECRPADPQRFTDVVYGQRWVSPQHQRLRKLLSFQYRLASTLLTPCPCRL